MKKKIQIEFYGIDSWNRPIYKAVNEKKFFGDTFNLFGYNEEDEAQEFYLKYDNVKFLTYFGSSFDCEPLGVQLDDTELEIV